MNIDEITEKYLNEAKKVRKIKNIKNLLKNDFQS